VERLREAKELGKILERSDKPVIVGFFGDFSVASRQAETPFEDFCEKHKDQPAVFVDVGKVKGAHKEFGVDTVPTVLLVKDGKVIRKIVGPQSRDYYEKVLSMVGAVHKRSIGGKEENKPSHRVVLYVGDSCPWCARARNYLRKQGIQFREVNVSRNQSLAAELVSKSGNQGVPQLDIDGHWVIGFDVAKINRLLGLNAANA